MDLVDSKTPDKGLWKTVLGIKPMPIVGDGFNPAEADRAFKWATSHGAVALNLIRGLAIREARAGRQQMAGIRACIALHQSCATPPPSIPKRKTK